MRPMVTKLGMYVRYGHPKNPIDFGVQRSKCKMHLYVLYKARDISTLESIHSVRVTVYDVTLRFAEVHFFNGRGIASCE